MKFRWYGLVMFAVGLVALLLVDVTLEPEQEPLPTRALAADVLPTALPRATIPPTHTPVVVPTATPTPTPVPCLEPGRVTTSLFPSQTTGLNHAYHIYLPPCYGQDPYTYPTLYMFHGLGQSDNFWDIAGLDEAANAAILAQEIPPLIIVMPNGNPIANVTSGGAYSFEAQVIDDLIPYIEETYCAWPVPAGRAIGGLSRGGYWSLEIAFRNPHLFASVGGHSAALLDIAAPPDINPQYTGLNNPLSTLRIYLDMGEEDAGLPNMLQLHQGMNKISRTHTWVLNPGGHTVEYWSEHTTDYLTWYSDPWSTQRRHYPKCPPTP